MPEISIIIPTLNEEKLINRTLEQFTPQLKEQNSLEIIISDGGSTDKTLENLPNTVDIIVRENPDKKQNIPIGRNAGAKSAKGSLLYFINADTRIEDTEKFFSISTDAFRNKNIAALTCCFKVFPEEVKLSDKMFHGFYNNYVRLLNSTGMGMGRGECQMIRTEIFKKVNGYNELLAAGEDYDIYRRIKKTGLGKIKFLNELTVYESPRRYRKYGYLKVFSSWTRNSLSVFFKNKSVSDEWEEVR